MKTLIAIIGVILTSAAAAQDVVATTLFSDGSTNTWTQADLLQALQLINRKYHRDCKSGEGRRAWHGAMREEIVVSTNLTDSGGPYLIKKEIHEDGSTFTYTSRVVTAAVNVAASNARLKTTMSRGVPTALAAARARREQEKNTVSNVTVTIEANAK